MFSFILFGLFACTSYNQTTNSSLMSRFPKPQDTPFVFVDVPLISGARPITLKDPYGKNFLRYKDSKVTVDGISTTVQIKTYVIEDKSPEDISKFYKIALPKAGWKFESARKSNNMVFDTYQKPLKRTSSILNIFFRKHQNSTTLYLTFKVSRAQRSQF